MKNIMPKNPLAAAGVGILIGAGIAGFKMWSRYKEGEVTQKEAVAGVVKQGIVFGGVAAASTLAGGQGGGGMGMAAMSVLGMSGGGGGGGGNMLPGMISQVMGAGGSGGAGRGKGGMGAGGGGVMGSGGEESSGLLDTISNSIADAIVSDETDQPEDASISSDSAKKGEES